MMTMNMDNLTKALATMREKMSDFNWLYVEKITPCADGGIVFKTNRNTTIKWFTDGTLVESDAQAWRR